VALPSGQIAAAIRSDAQRRAEDPDVERCVAEILPAQIDRREAAEQSTLDDDEAAGRRGNHDSTMLEREESALNGARFNAFALDQQ
jgi:hypothetical protein